MDKEKIIQLQDSLEKAWVWSGIPHALGKFTPIAISVTSYYERLPRVYHTLDHIAHCLCELGDAPVDYETRLRLRLAIWYHDVIYEPKRNDNEKRSAAYFMSDARVVFVGNTDNPNRPISQCNLGGTEGIKIKPRVFNIFSLILSTQYDSKLESEAERYLHDIDYSILGQPLDLFLEYDSNIRKEYGHLSDVEFDTGRLHFLNAIFAKPRIFLTDYFYEGYEIQAKSNLGKAIDYYLSKGR